MSEVCSFCLGGETDVPPFGDTKDAEDLIHPCGTCSIVTHRKCLLDWFNSLPSDKLHIVDKDSLEQELHRSRDLRVNRNDYEIGQAPDGLHEIRIDIDYNMIGNWVSQMNRPLNPGSMGARGGNVLLLLAPCPQCKEDIMFSMRRSGLLSLNTGIKTMISRGLQYTGVFLGLTSALTGIVSMSYIGLTSCGLKMMDCILPEPLLIRLLTKQNSQQSLSLLSSVLLGKGLGVPSTDPNYSIDNLESALSKGLIDPFKFSRIPILPIILYRMRQSSFIQCFFGSKQRDLNISNWLTEFLINGYISSMGNHELAKSVYENCLSSVTNMIKHPASFYKYLNILRGIDLWSVNNMISMLIPIRILYDMLFRLTINQLHFNVTMKVRPRNIANTLSASDYDKLEDVKNGIENIKLLMKQKRARNPSDASHDFDIITWGKSKLQMIKKLFKENLVGKYFKLNFLLAILKLKACIRHDYSNTFIYNSFTIRCLTTVAWPFLSSKFGTMFYNLMFKNLSHIPKDKLIFASNIASLIFVVFVKDLINLYLSHKKADQLTQLSIINLDQVQAHMGISSATGATESGASGSSSNGISENFQSHIGSIPGGFEV